MENDKFISLQNISSNYNVEISFIKTLNELGMVQVIKVQDDDCIDEECLPDIERLMRMHYDLEINMAGIEAIWHLLQRVNTLQKELLQAKNRLNL
jgi:hypothetical protein